MKTSSRGYLCFPGEGKEEPCLSRVLGNPMGKSSYNSFRSRKSFDQCFEKPAARRNTLGRQRSSLRCKHVGMAWSLPVLWARSLRAGQQRCSRSRTGSAPCAPVLPGEAGAPPRLVLPSALRPRRDLRKWHLTKRISALASSPSLHEEPLRQEGNLLIHREGTRCRHSCCSCRCNPGSFWCAVRTLSSLLLMEGIKWNSNNGTDKWKENCNHVIMSEASNSHEKPIKAHYADRCNRVLLASPLQWHAWQLRELYWQHTVKTVIMYSEKYLETNSAQTTGTA